VYSAVHRPTRGSMVRPSNAHRSSGVARVGVTRCETPRCHLSQKLTTFFLALGTQTVLGFKPPQNNSRPFLWGGFGNPNNCVDGVLNKVFPDHANARLPRPIILLLSSYAQIVFTS